MPKESKTSEQLLDLVHARLKRVHTGPRDGSIKIICVANYPNRNWRIAHSGEAGSHSVDLDEAEAALTDLYDLGT